MVSAVHDLVAAHQAIHRWYFLYDEGHLDVCATMVTEDCWFSSRTETGRHPHEQFIASDSRGRDAAMAWTKDHRAHSPYPLRHQVRNIFVTAERGDELDLDSYLFVTRIADRRPATLSSGIVHWTLRRVVDGAAYDIVKKETVLDSIESAPFSDVAEVRGRIDAW